MQYNIKNVIYKNFDINVKRSSYIHDTWCDELKVVEMVL